MTRLFHTTEAASAILSEGFRDGHGHYMFSVPMIGVFLARFPVDVNEGAKGDQVLDVTFPEDVDLDEYAIREEGSPVWEYLVPADVINARATVRLLDEESAQAEISRSFEAAREMGQFIRTPLGEVEDPRGRLPGPTNRGGRRQRRPELWTRRLP